MLQQQPNHEAELALCRRKGSSSSGGGCCCCGAAPFAGSTPASAPAVTAATADITAAQQSEHVSVLARSRPLAACRAHRMHGLCDAPNRQRLGGPHQLLLLSARLAATPAATITARHGSIAHVAARATLAAQQLRARPDRLAKRLRDGGAAHAELARKPQQHQRCAATAAAAPAAAAAAATNTTPGTSFC